MGEPDPKFSDEDVATGQALYAEAVRVSTAMHTQLREAPPGRYLPPIAGTPSACAAAGKTSCRSHAGDVGSQCVLPPRPRQVVDFLPDQKEDSGDEEGQGDAEAPQRKKRKT